jgi:hypothetical protein
MLNLLRRQILEADIDIIFGLTDEAEQAFQSGNGEAVRRILHDAEEVLFDIDTRLRDLPLEQRTPYQGLLEEAQRDIELIRSHAA